MPTPKKDMEGEGIKEIIKGLNKLLKKHKVISKGAPIIAPLAGKHASKVRKAGKVAGALGYGKTGQGLKLAGQGPKYVKKKRTRMVRKPTNRPKNKKL